MNIYLLILYFIKQAQFRFTLLVMAITVLVSSSQIGQVFADATCSQEQIYASGIHYFDCASASGSSCSGGSTTLTGPDNETKIWNYLKGKGLSDNQAAAIVGNWQQESSWDPEEIQNGGRSQNPADAGSGGWGLVQWTPGIKVLDEAKTYKITGPIYDLATQLDLAWAEMKGGFNGFSFSTFQQQPDLASLTSYFANNFEVAGTIGPRLQYAQDALNKYKGTGGSGDSSSGGCTSGSPDCQTATGDAKILCEAKKYDPTSYSNAGGVEDGHGSPAAWHQQCPTIGPSCYTDCSGLVNLAVYDAFNVDLGGYATFQEVTDSAHWKHISLGQIKTGDLIQPNPDHVEIIDHVQGGTIYTFGSHTSHVAQPNQVGPASYPKSSGYVFLHYIGPGSS